MRFYEIDYELVWVQNGLSTNCRIVDCNVYWKTANDRNIYQEKKLFLSYLIFKYRFSFE